MPSPEIHGIRPENMDTSVNPGVDFYHFANGGWIKRTQLPASETRWGTFEVLRESTLVRLRGIFEELAAGQFDAGTNERKIGDFYAAAMNESAIEVRGPRPLRQELALINKLKSIGSSAALIARLHRCGVSVFFGFGSSPDFDDSTHSIADAMQSGLGMPDRDYYLSAEDKKVKLRQGYVAHIARMFQLLGTKANVAARQAAAVLELETAMAQAFMDKADAQQPSKTKHKMSRAEFAQLFDALPLDRYFQKLGAPAFDVVNVSQPDYFRALNELLKKTSAWKLRAYMRWHLLNETAALLSKAFVDEHFDFFGRQMRGAKEQQPRWKRMTDLTSDTLGKAVGKIYVARYFPPEAKAKMEELFAQIKQAFRESIPLLTRLSDASKKKALEKLEHFEGRFGYPEKWRDYSALQVDRCCVVRNAFRAAAFESAFDLAKIGQPVDASEWDMNPQTVNAEADPITLKLTFPAGILQPPFFDLQADVAALLGAIGAVIGHEGTHPFDHNGMQYDPDGNQHKWVTDAEEKAYDAEVTDRLIAQYNAMTTSDGTHVKGDRVIGEATADLGLRVAYRALEAYIAKHGTTTDANGYNDRQRFFIAFGQLWAEVVTPEREDQDVLEDEHPEGHFRVNGTLANLGEFADAFGLPQDSPIMLPPEKRALIW